MASDKQRKRQPANGGADLEGDSIVTPVLTKSITANETRTL